jgi:hypothetical protein
LQNEHPAIPPRRSTDLTTYRAAALSLAIGLIGGLIAFSPASQFGVRAWGISSTDNGAFVAIGIGIVFIAASHGIAAVLALSIDHNIRQGPFSVLWAQLRPVLAKCSFGVCAAGLSWVLFEWIIGEMRNALFITSVTVLIVIILVQSHLVQAFLRRG